MAQNRYNMTGKQGHYVESLDREKLVTLRSKQPRMFKGRHITRGLQRWDSIIVLDRIYPAECYSRWDFIEFNRRQQQDDKA